MPQIIPAIIAKDLKDLKEKIDLVKDYTQTVQLDVMDGVFVPAKSFGNWEELNKIKGIKFEIHLMTANPLMHIVGFNKQENVSRIIFHKEAVADEDEFFACLREIKSSGKQVGVALNLETSTSEIEKFLPQIDMVLLMSVVPGKSGQDFIPEVIPKIFNLRRIWPGGKIEVDGGIKKESAKKVVEAGADVLAVGSYIFKNTESLKKKIGELKKIN